MKRIAAYFCFLVLVASASVAGATDEIITKLSDEQMARSATVLPESGIVASGQPSEAALRNVAAAGFGTVIDMRAADEDRGIDEERIVKDLGMSYVAFPLASKEDISFAKAAELDALLSSIEGPVLVHCASGNRVGAIFALRAKNNGADSADALALGKSAGLTRLEGVVKERLEIK